MYQLAINVIKSTAYMKNSSMHFINSPKYYLKIFLYFNITVRREYIFKSIIGSDSLHENNNDNKVRAENFVT